MAELLEDCFCFWGNYCQEVQFLQGVYETANQCRCAERLSNKRESRPVLFIHVAAAARLAQQVTLP
jgi:hypothetical protein